MLRIDYLPLVDLVGATHNPKLHHQDLIGRSIGRFGFVDPIEVDDRTGRLVSGHGRVEALRAAYHAGQQPPAGIVDRDGAWLVPVVRGWASNSDEEAAAYSVTTNRSSELGGWAHEELAVLLDQIGDPDLVALTGWNPEELAELLDPGGDGDGGDPPGPADQVDDTPLWGIAVTCRDEHQQEELLGRLTAEGYTARAVP